ILTCVINNFFFFLSSVYLVKIDVILPCSSKKKDNLTHEVFDWKKNYDKEVFLYVKGKHYNNGKTGQDEDFKNRVDFFEDQLQFGNASIRIKKTKLTDSGIYRIKVKGKKYNELNVTMVDAKLGLIP
uniref:Immunoglobulin V-set domain-containing protein n=1 Tax=Poecilia reticulata TaxID=8081 RepID=A0A3P9PB46_POERE